MEFKDYYQSLGVAKTATQDEIKKAYRKLARKFHPDVSKEPDAEARMKEVNEAYAVLSDTEKRVAYDNVGQGYQAGQEFHAPPNWDAGYEFSGADSEQASDFFENLFGHMREGRRAQGQRQQGQRQPGQRHQQMDIPGEDQHAKIVIDLIDAFHGATRQLVLQAPQIDASGHVFMQERKLDVKIPAGVKEGQHIRLTGLGLPGMGASKPGDLYLEVHFSPNEQYRVDGRDVYAKTPVTPWEAAIGGEIDVATPNGKVRVTVPAGSQSGRKLRLKGRGVPGKPQGDLYLVLDVVLPVAKTDRDREIYQTMAREMAFNPRQQITS